MSLVSRCTSAPESSSESAFAIANAIRGRWSKKRWRTNPRHLFRYCDATLHVRDFRRMAAVAEAVVRCMWPEKAQAMMKELYDDGFNLQGGAHCCALEYDRTSLLCFCEDDGSIVAPSSS